MNAQSMGYFRAVAETGGFSRGAERLGVSQPAVSLQISQLERSLGVALFDRLPRGVRLTAAGSLLLDYARCLAMLESEATQAIADLQGLQRGALRLGASLTVGSYLLPSILGEFRKRYPVVTLSMQIENTKHVQQMLLRGEIDLGFTEGEGRRDFLPPGLSAMAFHSDRLLPISRPDHPLLHAKRVTAAMLCREPMIFRESGSGTREVVESALAKRKIRVAPAMELGSAEAIKRAVAAGAGVAIVSELALADEIASGKLAVVPVVDLSIVRPLHVLRLRGKTDSAAAAAFAQLVSRSVLKG